MAKVMATHKDEVGGRFHEVRFTKGDNLNTARVKRFMIWSNAKKFAIEKAQEYGVRPIIS